LNPNQQRGPGRTPKKSQRKKSVVEISKNKRKREDYQEKGVKNLKRNN